MAILAKTIIGPPTQPSWSNKSGLERIRFTRSDHSVRSDTGKLSRSDGGLADTVKAKDDREDRGSRRGEVEVRMCDVCRSFLISTSDDQTWVVAEYAPCTDVQVRESICFARG